MGEAASAAAGMKVSELNEILEKIVSEYEVNYKNAPAGKRFQECYDVVTVKPSDEYLAVYDKVVAKLRDLGLNIQ